MGVFSFRQCFILLSQSFGKFFLVSFPFLCFFLMSHLLMFVLFFFFQYFQFQDLNLVHSEVAVIVKGRLLRAKIGEPDEIFVTAGKG